LPDAEDLARLAAQPDVAAFLADKPRS
jgi:hypothetical protein